VKEHGPYHADTDVTQKRKRREDWQSRGELRKEVENVVTPSFPVRPQVRMRERIEEREAKQEINGDQQRGRRHRH